MFADILAKEKLDRNDLELIIDRVLVFEDHLEIKLQRDIDSILRYGTLEEAANFNSGIENSLHCRLVQSADKRPDKVFDVNVISDGDPLEIFVSNEGEFIFKKYSPISELGSIAAQYCEVLYRTAGFPVLITDRDHVVAVSGISRREVLERRVSHGLEDQIENRRSFSAGDGQPLQPIEGVAYYALVQSPIISSGDVCGSVMFLQNKESDRPGDAEQKLIQAAASYLGKQMEL